MKLGGEVLEPGSPSRGLIDVMYPTPSRALSPQSTSNTASSPARHQHGIHGSGIAVPLMKVFWRRERRI